MTLQQLLFDDTVDQISLVTDMGTINSDFVKFGGVAVNANALISDRGALKSSLLQGLNREGDIENGISLSTAGVYVSKSMFRESSPFYREYIGDVVVIFPTYHFLVKLRRCLSGEVAVGSTLFSEAELAFYNSYIAWVNGAIIVGELLIAVEALDTWLLDEITSTPHPELIREYGPTHKWMKLGTRT